MAPSLRLRTVLAVTVDFLPEPLLRPVDPPVTIVRAVVCVRDSYTPAQQPDT